MRALRRLHARFAHHRHTVRDSLDSGIRTSTHRVRVNEELQDAERSEHRRGVRDVRPQHGDRAEQLGQPGHSDWVVVLGAAGELLLHLGAVVGEPCDAHLGVHVGVEDGLGPVGRARVFRHVRVPIREDPRIRRLRVACRHDLHEPVATDLVRAPAGRLPS